MSYLNKCPKEIKGRLKEKLIKERRRTGKTTGACMSIISECLKNPGVTFKVYDFEPYAALPRHFVNRNVVMPTIQDILHRLDLQNFTINKTNETITYHLPKWMTNEEGL